MFFFIIYPILEFVNSFILFWNKIKYKEEKTCTE